MSYGREENSGDQSVVIEIDGVVRQSEKAVLYQIKGDEHWIPKSQIRAVHDDQLHIEIPRWLADKNQLDFEMPT